MDRVSARALAASLILLASVASLLPIPRAAGDPWIVDNPDGTSDAVWNFTSPADYTLANTQITGGAVSLASQPGWWNSTTAADFAGPDSAMNVDLARWPGDVAMASTSGSATLLTLQPDPAAGMDTWLDRNNPALNHGGDATLVLDGRTPQSRPILQFDLSALPANAVVDDTTLSLYQGAGIGNSFTATVYGVTAQWSETQATWNERLSGVSWTSAGGDWNGHAIDQRLLDNTAGWRAWNVTQLVDLWHRGRLPNYGLILFAPNPGADSDKTFYSSDYLTDPTLRPRLDIRYRLLGATAEYVSKVGGTGSSVQWQTIAWNATAHELVSDEFDGASLDPKWIWTNPPASFDVGATTPGHLHVVSGTGVDILGGTFTGNVLSDTVVGDFTAEMKFTNDPAVNGQKAGLMALVTSRDWYGVQRAYVGATATVNWQLRSTVDAVTTTRVDLVSGNPNPAWVRLVRTGNTFQASTSADGTTWTVQDTYNPAFEYPLRIRVAFYVADGLSGTANVADVDHIRVRLGNDATVTVQTRTGNTTPVDAAWSGWSAPYPAASGSAMAGSSRYVEFRLSMAVTYPDHTPAVGDVNISWSNYVSSGTVETNDLVAADLALWGNFTVVEARNGQSIAYEYSLDSGGSWTPVVPPASLQAVSIATGRIRFRATLSTADPTVTPALSELRLTYRHGLDHFYVTASASALAGGPFSVTVTAKDAVNATLAGWTGTVTLDATLLDGITPGGGVLGTTSLAVTSGGTATLATETYTKAEAIRIRATSGTATGLSGRIDVSPGAATRVAVTPDNVTLLPFDGRTFSAQAFDAWNNTVPGGGIAWTVVGGVGTLNTSTGPSVQFVASPPAGRTGSLEAALGGATGVAAIRVVSGVPPWVAILAPAAGAHVTGVVPVRYANGSSSVSVQFDYDAGAGWIPIGSTAVLNGTFLWDTTGLDFTGGTLRATVADNRTVTNTTTVSPIEVDNTPPAIALGAVVDDQAVSGTLTIAYTTDPDVVRVDLSFFDGAWRTIGSDATIDGSYVWTPGSAINGVTLRAVAVDDVNLTGAAENQGVGTRIVGSNPPTIAPIPDLRVRAGTPYDLNLTFYLSDPDTPLSALAVSVSDAANVTATAGAYPSLRVAYAAPGTYVVTLWVSDGTDTAWMLLRVIASTANPPVLSAPLPVVAFDEDTIAANALGAPATGFFTDADGDPLTFALVGGANVSGRVNADGTLDFWAAANWSGAEAFRLRAADPLGGFAESALLVVVRAVNDAPVLAPIADLRIDEGATATLDLTPYVTDIDTNLSQIVAATDSPYVTANGRVLTLAFPAGLGEAAFTVTISDGAATSSQPVRVTFQPPWWKAPYVLAVPPIGIILVVGMFAQRARWRPAKAFLVDERKRLLREFTLDPACKVTYDQALKAGAYDAVEKPVRVSKYHARTVKGDALAVVLLAYGPVSLEQVEFAREMLVNIQDKFEDAVKERLETARAVEENLDATARDLEAEREALSARSQAFAGAMDATTLGLSKIAAESAAVRSKALEIERREGRLGEELQELDTFRRELESRQASLAAKAAELKTREAGIASLESSLSENADRLSREQAEFEAKVRTLETDRAEVEETRREVDRESTRLSSEAETLRAKEADLAGRVARLEEGQEELSRQRAEIEPVRASLETRGREITELDAALAERTRALDAREARIAPLESELSAREVAVAEREARVQEQTEAVGAKAVELTTQARDLEGKEAALSKDRTALDEAQRSFGPRLQEFEARVARFEDESRRRKEELDVQSKALGEDQLKLAADKESFEAVRSERGQWIATKEIEIEAREQSLQEKEAAVRTQAEENARRLTDLAAREETLEIESDKLEKARAELASRQAETERLAKATEAKASALREDETRKAEEFRSWQATMESQQALLRQQREAFEKETAERKESWAMRLLQVEQREADLAERESRLREDLERLARADAEMARREAALQEAQRAAAEGKAAAEVEKKANTDRAFDLERRERVLREEAAKLTDELARRAAAVKAADAETAGMRARAEQEIAARTRRIEERDGELRRGAQALVAKELSLKEREAALASLQAALGEQEERLAREETDLDATAKRLDAKEVDLQQVAQRNLEESEHLRTEADAIRQSLAAKEAELRSERERLERESNGLQDRLGAKAQELAAREKALAAREAEAVHATQKLEADRASWTERYARDMKQLEATQQAVAEQTQRSERLIEEAQRRAVVASEAEKSARRQADELRALQAQLEERRLAAEKAERGAEVQVSQLNDASRRLGAREIELQSLANELQAREAKLTAAAGEATRTAEELRTRRSALDQEAARTAKSAADLETRRTELDARTAALEAKAADLVQREQVLTTELQRAENLMEDLHSKETELKTREQSIVAARAGIMERESALSMREAELRQGTAGLERGRQEAERRAAETESDRAAAAKAREEALALKAQAEKDKAQSESMQQEVSRNMKFLQRKAVDVLEKEENLRARELKIAESENALQTRDEILRDKERVLEVEREELVAKAERAQAEVAKLKAKLAEVERGGASTAEREEWRRDIENRVKIVQRKAMELLDREEKLRKKEEELRALAERLGVHA